MDESTAPKAAASPCSPPLLADSGDAAAASGSSGVAPVRRSGKEPERKRAKVEEGGTEEVRCQVEGCEVELGAAKEYHRKHRVCKAHTKCPRVIVAGQECRFCQQCSRFHALSEFDQAKRSCRRRLSDHNVPRRKARSNPVTFAPAKRPSLLFESTTAPGQQLACPPHAWTLLCAGTGEMEAQAMCSSLGAIGPLLRKLCSLLVYPEYKLPNQLKPQKQIELLKQDLEGINTLLVDLSKVEAPNTMAKLWMNEVRDLFYDIEDYIDKSMHLCSNTSEETPFEIEEFSTLVNQASDALKRHQRYELGRGASIPSFIVDQQGPVPTLNGKATDLIGIDDSRSKLIMWLTDEAEQQLKVIPILGPAGVGKTTLAKEVYRAIGGRFECRAFVRASRMPDTRRLLRSMISQVQRHQRPPYAYTVQDLIDNLSEHLQHKRYFIVIDGLWETISWDIVMSSFPEGTHCSRILITTDIEEVALECCDFQSDCIFKMEPLSRNDSTEVFFNRVFGSNYKYSEQLKEVSEGIIRKCSGLPLATISVASILASQPENSKLWHYVQECLSRKTLTSEHMLTEIVGLSYNSLTHHLKTCLLYLSMYPEGYTFQKSELVKQWIAEGFISVVAGKDTKEVADCYFDQLVCRGLIEPNHITFSAVIFYTVHSTVFDVIRYKCIEDNFTTVIDYSETITKVSAKVRRLSLSFSNVKYATKPEGITLSQVRSLTFYGLLECLPLITEFKLLRVLRLEFWGAQEELDISGMNRLFELRYVRIRTDITVKLPTSMQGLQYLETLELCAKVTTVSSDIFHLPRLLHLCLHGDTNLPDGIGHMRSLRTLQSFDLSSNSEDNVLSLGEMTNLQYLHLTCSAAMPGRLQRNLIALSSSLGKLGNLKSLILAPGPSCTSIYLNCLSSVSALPLFLQRLELLPPICIFPRFPKWLGQLQKLCILKIVVRELTNDAVNSISGLHDLSILSLYVRQPTAESIIINSEAFPLLKYFKFRCGVLRLAFHAKAMHNLQKLKLEFNAHRGEQYGDMLAGIEHLLNLHEIAGRIGAAAGAEESDRTAAESVFMDAISKNSGLPSFNIRWINFVDEEISKISDPPASSSRSDDEVHEEDKTEPGDFAFEPERIKDDNKDVELNRPTMACVVSKPNETDMVQKVSPSSDKRRTSNPVCETRKGPKRGQILKRIIKDLTGR